MEKMTDVLGRAHASIFICKYEIFLEQKTMYIICPN